MGDRLGTSGESGTGFIMMLIRGQCMVIVQAPAGSCTAYVLISDRASLKGTTKPSLDKTCDKTASSPMPTKQQLILFQLFIHGCLRLNQTFFASNLSGTLLFSTATAKKCSSTYFGLEFVF